MLTGSLLWVSCGKPKEVAAPAEPTTNKSALGASVPVALEPWIAKAKELTADIKPGMTEDDVLKLVGDPTMVKTAIGVQGEAVWQYDLGSGNWFTVQFDKSNRVASAGLVNPIKPQ